MSTTVHFNAKSAAGMRPDWRRMVVGWPLPGTIYLIHGMPLVVDSLVKHLSKVSPTVIRYKLEYSTTGFVLLILAV